MTLIEVGSAQDPTFRKRKTDLAPHQKGNTGTGIWSLLELRKRLSRPKENFSALRESIQKIPDL
jgi:hypothetical protein